MGSDDFGLPNLKYSSLDELDYERQIALDQMQRDLDAAAEEQLYEQDVEVAEVTGADSVDIEETINESARMAVFENNAQKLADAGEVGPSEQEEDDATDTGIWKALFNGKIARSVVSGSMLPHNPLLWSANQLWEFIERTDQYTHFRSNMYDSQIQEPYGKDKLLKVDEQDILNTIDYLDLHARSNEVGRPLRQYSEQEFN